MPSDLNYKRYLALLAAATTLVLAAMAAFNLAMDPYYVWGWSWAGNRDKAWIYSPQTVAVEAALRRPATLFVGRSHVALGFDPHSPAVRAWERPYLYHAMGWGMDFEFENQALAAMSASGQLKQAVIELDPRQFVTCNGAPAAPASMLNGLETTLLSGALGKSMGVLRRNLGLGGDSADIYLRYGSGPVRRVPETKAAFESDLGYASQYLFVTPAPCPAQDPTLGFARLDRLVALARSRHVALTFFIGALHPRMLVRMRQVGTWQRIEWIKRRLAAYSAQHGLTIWDFSTAEATPTAAAGFVDPVHFVPAIGDQMLWRMRAGPTGGGTFGRLLTPATIEATILEDRRAIAACATQAAATTG